MSRGGGCVCVGGGRRTRNEGQTDPARVAMPCSPCQSASRPSLHTHPVHVQSMRGLPCPARRVVAPHVPVSELSCQSSHTPAVHARIAVPCSPCRCSPRPRVRALVSELSRPCSPCACCHALLPMSEPALLSTHTHTDTVHVQSMCGLSCPALYKNHSILLL